MQRDAEQASIDFFQELGYLKKSRMNFEIGLFFFETYDRNTDFIFTNESNSRKASI